MAKRTPLYETHKKLGAKLVEFAGWEMPVQYSGINEEHLAVRSAAGLFDVSHMGEIEITGPDAAAYAQHLTASDVSQMTDGRAHYSLLLNERATVIDDIIVYRFNAERFIFVVNASNVDKDFVWILNNARGNVDIKNTSDDYALIAFQGPLAAQILQGFTPVDIASIGKYHFAEGPFAGCPAGIIARTGYTGEDGFELFCAPEHAQGVWNALLDAGAPRGVLPAGLAARDTLRLEMKYSLYGHEITEETNPYEAGLGWVVKLDQDDDFIGKKQLIAIKEAGVARKLIGFKMLEKAIPRQGYPIVCGGKPVGSVTSGTLSPSLGIPIGIGYVPHDHAKIGTHISVDIRGKQRDAEIVKTPFYKQ